MTRARRVDEKMFKDAVCAALCERPETRAWVQNSGLARALDNPSSKIALMPTGAADVGACSRVGDAGVWVQVECKMPRRQRTPAQRNWARLVDWVGGVYLLAVYDPRLDLAANARAARDAVAVRLAALGKGAATRPFPEFEPPTPRTSKAHTMPQMIPLASKDTTGPRVAAPSAAHGKTSAGEPR